MALNIACHFRVSPLRLSKGQSRPWLPLAQLIQLQILPQDSDVFVAPSGDIHNHDF